LNLGHIQFSKHTGTFGKILLESEIFQLVNYIFLSFIYFDDDDFELQQWFDLLLLNIDRFLQICVHVQHFIFECATAYLRWTRDDRSLIASTILFDKYWTILFVFGQLVCAYERSVVKGIGWLKLLVRFVHVFNLCMLICICMFIYVCLTITNVLVDLCTGTCTWTSRCFNLFKYNFVHRSIIFHM
jgi:hypothetical protein